MIAFPFRENCALQHVPSRPRIREPSASVPRRPHARHEFEERSHFLSFLPNEGWHARNSCKQSCSTCTEPPPQSAATLGISFLLVARLLRFALVREGQYRERSPLSKPLVKASVKTFDQFVDYLEPASSLNLCRG
jgi:hypothetical protein